LLLTPKRPQRYFKLMTDQEIPEPRPLPWRPAISSIFATTGLLLLPKCPLCVAAYLVSLGLGLEAARDAAPFVRPVAWALVLLAVAALVLSLRRARNRPPTHLPCCGSSRLRGVG
jgi:hypothetical protein